MRIALVSSEYPPADYLGGIGTNTATVAPALARRGHEVCVVTRGQGSDDSEDGVRVMRVDHRWLPSRPAETLLALRTIARAVDRFRPDIVHAAEWEAEAWWITRFRQRPVVTRLATPSYVLDELNRRPLDARGRLIRALERDQARQSALVFGPTKAILDRVSADWGLSKDRLVMVPNPIEIEKIRTAGTCSPPMALPSRYLVFFGRLERRKGIEVLAAALPGVLEGYPDVHAVFIGRDAGDEGGELMLRFHRLLDGYSDRVHMLGELRRRDALAVVARSELVVLPSLWESFGYVAVESMALSRAVIATRVGGFPEFIEDGRTGWLVPPADANALADSIHARLADPDGSRRIGEAASAASERFDVEEIVDDLVALYDRALELRRSDGFDASVYRKGYRRYFNPDERSEPFHRLYEKKRDSVLQGFAGSERLKLVDVGGGYGRLASPLAQTHDVTLVDVSPEMLQQARETCPAGVELVLADARELPFADASFDAVLALDLLTHLPDLNAGLAELKRVARPGARIVFDTTNSVPLWVLRYPSYTSWRPKRLLITLLSGGVLPEWRRIVRHHRDREVRAAIAAAGLELERRESFGPPLVPKWHLWWTRRP
jgi:glycogen(starch) synthase